jgi:hypothetical protein
MYLELDQGCFKVTLGRNQTPKFDLLNDQAKEVLRIIGTAFYRDDRGTLHPIERPSIKDELREYFQSFRDDEYTLFSDVLQDFQHYDRKETIKALLDLKKQGLISLSTKDLAKETEITRA